MTYIKNRSLHYFDYVYFALFIILVTIGIIAIFSATYTPETPYSPYFIKQLIGGAMGIGIFLIASFIPPRTLMRNAYFSYYLLLAVLVFTLIKGSIGMGGRRWINLGLFKLQPSELAKILLPPFLVYNLNYGDHAGIPRDHLLFPLLASIGASFLLIRKQPDLGTACIILFSGITLLWIANINRKIFIAIGIATIISAPLLWTFLKPYQKTRILVFLGYGDTKKERYQIEQAAIAIGSGGLIGKGFLKGTQNKLHFLPESRTDCIFAVIAEEWGFVGTMVILLLYLLLFIRLFFIVKTIPNGSLQLLTIGLILPILFSTIINIGMVTNLLPVVGIPLPLISYGLSNLWVTCATLGWIQGIAIQERM